MNLTGANLLGVARSKLINHGLGQFIDPADRELWDQYFAGVRLQEEKRQFCTLSLIRGDRSQFPARLEGVRITGSDGVISVRITVSDITDIKAAEDALRESEARYRPIITNTPVGFFRLDKDGLFQEVNDAWLGMHGFSAKTQVIGQHFSLTQVNVDQKSAQDYVNYVIQGGQIPSGEFSRRKKDGSVGYHTFSAVPVIKEGQTIGLEGFLFDITERKAVDEALRESEKKYRTLVETLNEGIWVIDKDAVTTFVNPKMAMILGYSIDEMNGRSLFSFMDDEGRRISERNIERRKQGIKEQHYFEFLQKDGTRIYASLEVTPLTGKDGEYLGAIAGVMDITDRKRAEDLLQESERKFTAMFQGSPIALTLVSAMDGVFVHVNDAFLESYRIYS